MIMRMCDIDIFDKLLLVIMKGIPLKIKNPV